MKLVYIAGPYRASTERGVVLNIRKAEEMALRCWLAGAAVICPHKNTALFGGAAPDSVWLEGDLEMVRRCDAVVCVEGWEDSAGTRGEIQLAVAIPIPVFLPREWADFERWLKA